MQQGRGYWGFGEILSPQRGRFDLPKKTVQKIFQLVAFHTYCMGSGPSGYHHTIHFAWWSPSYWFIGYEKKDTVTRYPGSLLVIMWSSHTVQYCSLLSCGYSTVSTNSVTRAHFGLSNQSYSSAQVSDISSSCRFIQLCTGKNRGPRGPWAPGPSKISTSEPLL